MRSLVKLLSSCGVGRSILLFGACAAIASTPAAAQSRAHTQTPPAAGAPIIAVDTPKDEEEDLPRKRLEWFYGPRQFPFGGIPAGARLNATRQVDQMMRAERVAVSAANGADLSTTRWTLIGPQPTVTNGSSGRVSALAVDPRNPDVAYAGAAQGGVWKTTDAGLTWTPLTDDQASLAIGSIALDPINPDIVYVGTGEQNFSGDSYYGAGVLKSTDAGKTWTLIQGPFAGPSYGNGGAWIGGLAIQPTNTQVLLAGVEGNPSGIFRSANAGATWTLVLPGASGTAVLFDPQNPSIAYAALGDPFTNPRNGVYKSTDAGLTWTKLDSAGAVISPTGLGRIVLAIAPSSPNIVYASAHDTRSAGLQGLYRTTDGGQSWSKLGPGANLVDYCRGQCWYDNVVAVHPTNPNVVFLGGSASNGTFFRSLDGGATWREIAHGANGQTLHVDHHAIAFSPDGARMYVGNDGGVWRTNDVSSAIVNWTDLNDTLSITQFYTSDAIHPSSPDIGLGGTQDNNVQRYGGSLAWESVTCGDGGWTAFDAAFPSTTYASCQALALLRSDTNGDIGTWHNITPGVPSDELIAFIPPFLADPTTALTLYLGTYRVWQSRDGGSSWAIISPDLSGGRKGIVSAVAISPANPNVIYAGTNNGKLWTTGNALSGANSSWTEIDAGLPFRSISHLAVDETNEAIVYVSYSGFQTASNLGHIFRSTDRGLSWTNISGNLPNTPVSDFALDPDVPGTLYAGTDVGVFQSSDGGVTWSTMMSGLPRVAVFSLKLHRPSRTLRAATHGRSVWDLKLANFSPTFSVSGIAPVGADIGDAALTLVVSGTGFTSGSTVLWNGAPRPTTFVSASQVKASISAADLSAASVVPVSVSDPAFQAASNALRFSIMQPPPRLTNLSPSSIPAGSPTFNLVVTGSGYTSHSYATFDGVPRPTAVAGSTALSTSISAGDIAEAGWHLLSIVTPGPPGGGVTPSYYYAASTTVVPENDNVGNALPITAPVASSTVNTFAATVEAADPPPCSGNRNHTVWYRFTASRDGVAALDTFGSAFDTVLAVYTGAPGAFTQVVCNDDDAGTRLSRVSFNASAGVTYFVMVSGWDLFSAGRLVLNSTLPVSPVKPQTGWWWDPKLSGMGFFVETGGISANGMFLAGFMYDAAGNPTWLVSTGAMNGSTYSNRWTKVSGGQTLTGPFKSTTSVDAGPVTIAFSDPSHATLTRPDGSTVAIERFSFTSMPIPAPVAGAAQGGWWWNASASGTGYAIEFQGNNAFVVGYVYDDSGNPVWYLAGGPLTSPTSLTASWDLYGSGPQFTSPEGNYSAQVRSHVAPVSITFTDATHGTITTGSTVIPITRFQSF